MGFIDRLALKRVFKRLQRNEISVSYAVGENVDSHSSRIGGNPCVPKDFEWPVFSTKVRGKDISCPLAFLAQINLEEVASLDSEQMLPSKGMLLFFYEVETMRDGLDPAEKGCARVFYFDDVASLVPRELPDDIPDAGRVPQIAISFAARSGLPAWEEYSLHDSREFDNELYNSVRVEYTGYDSHVSGGDFKLLGFADVIQDAMQRGCELVSAGFDLCNGPVKLTAEQEREVEQGSKDWILLFQMGTIASDDYELMFGDMGRIYFFIRRQDLAARHFDRAIMMMQCL